VKVGVVDPLQLPSQGALGLFQRAAVTGNILRSQDGHWPDDALVEVLRALRRREPFHGHDSETPGGRAV
jgi:hypothetical protein